MIRDPEQPRGSVRVATLGGVALQVSFSTALLVAVLAVACEPQVDDLHPGLGPGAYAVGAAVGVLVYLAVLLHEGAHAVVARRFGHRVTSITLSAVGGRTAIDGEARTPREEFLTAGAGPVASLVLGGVALVVRLGMDDGLAALGLEVLVLANLVLGGLDLVPAPPLDGGRLVKAVAWRVQGSPRRGAVTAAKVGRGVAVVLAATPILAVVVLGLRLTTTDMVLCGAMGLLLWTLSTNDLTVNRLRLQVGDVVVRDLARRTLTVPPDLPLAEAIRRATEDGAAGIVTVDARGTMLGVVGDDEVAATPLERRPWVTTATVAHPLTADSLLPVDITGEQLLVAINRSPAAEYLLVDPAGGLVGVLSLRDLDRAVRDR